MRHALWIVIGVAACGDDPSLRVDVEHPVPVTRTTISVYESDSIRCDNIEFGDLSEDELIAARVAELVVGPDGTSGSLDGLSRTEMKMIVARGYDADGRFLTAGCVEKELVGDDDDVLVRTTRAAVASIGPLMGDTADGTFTIQVVVTDATGAALPNNRVSWRVYAPRGAPRAATASELTFPDPSETGEWQLAAPTCTGGSGVVTVHPVPPATVGGFAVQVRPSWAVQAPPLVTAFSRIDSGVQVVVPAPNVRRPCAIRRSGGAPTLVCVERVNDTNPTIVSRAYAVTVNAMGRIAFAPQAAEAVPQDVAAVFALGDDVHAITRTGMIVRLRDQPATKQVSLAGSEEVHDALVLPACGTSDLRLALRTENSPSPPYHRVVTVDPTVGGAPALFNNAATGIGNTLALRSAGCVNETDGMNGGGGTPRHAVIVEIDGRLPGEPLTSAAYFDCSAPNKARCHIDLPAARAGAGFTLDRTRIASAAVDASGVIVSEWSVLVDDGGMYRRVELDRYPAASLPLHIVFGHFDEGGDQDAFWDIANLDMRNSTFQVTYDRTAGAQRLSALAANQGFLVSEVLVGDVTDDTFDDVILLGTRSMDMQFGIVVIPTQVETRASGVSAADAPCAP